MVQLTRKLSNAEHAAVDSDDVSAVREMFRELEKKICEIPFCSIFTSPSFSCSILLNSYKY